MVIEYFMKWVQTAPLNKRTNAAVALARACTKRGLEDDERDEIEAALTVLLEDNASPVRLAIAETFGAFASAPRHIITSLAADKSEISVIVLSQSPVFHDAELVNWVRNGSRENQIAVSCRPWLSEEVTSAICKYGCKDAGLGLLMNSAAKFSQEDLHVLAQRHGEVTDIRLALSERDDLSIQTRHLLLGKLGAALGGLVKEKAWLSEDRMDAVIGEACDKASIIFAAKTNEGEVANVVRNLISQNRLTVAFLVRAICMGNITLVASALSELSGIRFVRVEAILTSNRETAFRAVYERAGLPKSAFVIFQTALKTWRRLLRSGSEINQARLPFIVTREVLDAYAGNTDTIVDELLVLLRKLSAEAARESSKAKAVEITERSIEAIESVPQALEQIEGSFEVEIHETEILDETPANQSTPAKQIVEIPKQKPISYPVDIMALAATDLEIMDDELASSQGILYGSEVKAA